MSILKDILIFQHYTEFWKSCFPKGFEYCLFLWFWNDSVYKWPQLIKSLFIFRLFIFRTIFVMLLWFMYRGFHISIVYPSSLKISIVSFWKLRGEKLIFICLFVQQSTESKLLVSPCPKRGWDHVGDINNRRRSSIMHISEPRFPEMSNSRCLSATVCLVMPRAKGNQLVMRLQSNTETASIHSRQLRSLSNWPATEMPRWKLFPL